MNLHPTGCNLCGGRVAMVSARDARMHGCDTRRRHYVCTQCRAFVGVYPGSDIQKGLLANQEMRRLKASCHRLLDPMWYRKKRAKKKRAALYAWLAQKMGIPGEDCSFDRFDLAQLKTAHQILKGVDGLEVKYNHGIAYFEPEQGGTNDI